MKLLKNIANKVYQQLKPGHTERIYHKAFEIELRNHNIPYETEKEILYKYYCTKGKEYVLGMGKIDIFIKDDNNPIILELKATTDKEIKETYKDQLRKYMRYSDYDDINGMVINFKQCPYTLSDDIEVDIYKCKLTMNQF